MSDNSVLQLYIYKYSRHNESYRLDGSGIESLWRRDFPYNPDRAQGQHSLLYNGHRVFIGGKAAGVYSWPTPSNADGKERVELYLYSQSGPSWPATGRTFRPKDRFYFSHARTINVYFSLLFDYYHTLRPLTAMLSSCVSFIWFQ